MAFDGITTACLCRELSGRLTGARIYKIAQTDRDELVLTLGSLTPRIPERRLPPYFFSQIQISCFS